MHNKMNSEQIEVLDAFIFHNQKLSFFGLYRQFTGQSLSQAHKALSQRYQYLRNHYPEKFTVSADEYWNEFYSDGRLCAWSMRSIMVLVLVPVCGDFDLACGSICS